MSEEERIGGFWFRPPRKDEIVEDEAGWEGVHIERMSTQGIWMGVTTPDGPVHFNFYVGEEKVENEDGQMVYPILLRVDAGWMEEGK